MKTVLALLVLLATPVEAAGSTVHGKLTPVERERLAAPPEAQALMPTLATPYHLRVVYLIPSNRAEQPGSEQTLQNYVLRIQAWLGEEMARFGHGDRELSIETEADGVTPRIHYAHSSRPDSDFHDPSYLERWSKLLGGISELGFPAWQPGELLLVVAETHVQEPDGSMNGSTVFFGGAGSRFSGVGMVTGETLARFRSGMLTDDRDYDGLVNPDIGPHPLVFGSSFPSFGGTTVSSISSAGQGGALHELAHGLGLWHDFRNDENFNGNVMGNGLRGLRGALLPDRYPDDDMRLSSSAARRLNHSRFLGADASPSDDRQPEVAILGSGDVQPENGLLRIRFQASDADSELAGAVLLRNFNAVADIPLSGTSLETSIETPIYSPGVEEPWNVAVFDTAGNSRISSQVRIVVTPGFNRAPVPYVETSSRLLETGEELTLSAARSTDPDGDDAQLVTEWDLDGDGSFDTAPTTSPTLVTRYDRPGAYRVVARVTDPLGASSLSMAIAIGIQGADTDDDGVLDEDDNCVQVANPAQEDVDAGTDDDTSLAGVQHYGDACDTDLDNDGIVGPSDFFGILRPCLGADLTTRPECLSADLDGDGIVAPSDFFARFRPTLGTTPGPGVTEP
ncbi:MAG: PKD domain-containing protein [Myxococcota bacterium]|nr:PKD domain-containing protein [Myxococcota bacterium]